MSTELRTIRDFLRYATSCFNEAELCFGHGTDNAWDEAIALIFHPLHLPYDIHPSVLDATLTYHERTILLSLIDKRVKHRMPVAYLTHEAWFAGLPFYVDERVLIPRSPIAELIAKQFQPWVVSPVRTILDLCTGSGCIAIACAKAFPEASIDASDISIEALAVAKINVLKHHVEDQVELHEADLFQGLPAKQYDIIVSNPPYISQAETDLLPREYQHEPALGLTSGPAGLEIVEHILKEARRYLSPHGVLIVEIGEQIEALSAAFPHLPFTWVEFEQGEGEVFVLHAADIK